MTPRLAQALLAKALLAQALLAKALLAKALLAQALLTGALVAGCGAKTGLLVPDAGPDGGMDAGVDAGLDAGADAGVCVAEPIALQRRGAQIMFVLDRSNSMDDTIDGRDPAPGEPRRWDELGDALERALRDADPLLEAGAKFYPNPPADDIGMPELACRVDPGIDLIPARGNVDALIRFFDTTDPSGGTPTAQALVEVADFFAARPAPGVPRFVVLATDGGPNCNPDTGIPAGRCVCTGGPDNCDPAVAGDFAAFNCLDRDRTLTAVRAVSEGLGVPVFVIGIDDPSRPDLADVLDEIALAGGRPRGVAGEREFYSVREEEDLNDALGTITRSVAQCVFSLRPAPSPVADLRVEIDGARIPRDEGRGEGWDYTAPDRSELTLFGEACAQVTDRGGEVTARVECAP